MLQPIQSITVVQKELQDVSQTHRANRRDPSLLVARQRAQPRQMNLDVKMLVSHMATLTQRMNTAVLVPRMLALRQCMLMPVRNGARQIYKPCCLTMFSSSVRLCCPSTSRCVCYIIRATA